MDSCVALARLKAYFVSGVVDPKGTMSYRRQYNKVCWNPLCGVNGFKPSLWFLVLLVLMHSLRGDRVLWLSRGCGLIW